MKIPSVCFAFILTFPVLTNAVLAEPVTADDRQGTNLVIYRPSQQAGLSYLDYRLYLNGKNLGKLSNGERMELQLDPGRYTLMANDADQSQLVFTVRAGNTTVVKAQVSRALRMPLVNMEIRRAVVQSAK